MELQLKKKITKFINQNTALIFSLDFNADLTFANISI